MNWIRKYREDPKGRQKFVQLSCLLDELISLPRYPCSLQYQHVLFTVASSSREIRCDSVYYSLCRVPISAKFRATGIPFENPSAETRRYSCARWITESPPARRYTRKFSYSNNSVGERAKIAFQESRYKSGARIGLRVWMLFNFEVLMFGQIEFEADHFFGESNFYRLKTKIFFRKATICRAWQIRSSFQTNKFEQIFNLVEG